MIAIAMLDRFSPGSLPGSTPATYVSSDKARLENAWDAALRIDFNCVPLGKVGWTYMGRSTHETPNPINYSKYHTNRWVFQSLIITVNSGQQNSIGVFIFGHGSLEDQLIVDAVPVSSNR